MAVSHPHTARALLLGGPGRYPFNGHLRFVVVHGGARLHVAGSVSVGCEPPVAYAAAAALRRALESVEGRGRFALLRGAWERLASLDSTALGPARGADLALLMVAEDASGLGVAGTGLADLYALDSGVTPLLDPEHPLLGIRGVPLDPPGVFTPHSPPALLVAGAASGALDPGPTGSWLEACGQRSGGLP